MDNWLYYKIYPKQPELLNEVILDIVKPTIKFFCSDIKSWFFIRYTDENGFHIRLRLFVSQDNNNKINDWFRAIEAKKLQELKVKTTKNMLGGNLNLSKNKFQNIKIIEDVYKPEYHKYGGNKGIYIAENLFRISSELALSILESTKKGVDINEASLTIMYQSLELLYDDTRKKSFLQGYFDYWTNNNDFLKNEVIIEYKKKQQHLTNFFKNILTQKKDDIYNDYVNGLFKAEEGIIKELQIPIDSLLFHYMHMMNNRIGVTIYEEGYLAYLIKLHIDNNVN